MSSKLHSVITGTGSYIPTEIVKNEDFVSNEFFDAAGIKLEKSSQEITAKFEEITTIEERRYVSENQVTSDIAFLAAAEAITSANIDKETLDYIIVAHNFGDATRHAKNVDIVPSIAARVKHKLQIENPNAVAYDIIFGCPGWVQAVIQAHYYIQSGDAKKILVIGADVISPFSDTHDRDGLLYADGAGAIILEAQESEAEIGILGHATRSDTKDYAEMLFMGESCNPNFENKGELFLKMNGRKLYQYALQTVPIAIKNCLDKTNISIKDLKKVFIHQANGKMDDAILSRLFKLYAINDTPKDIMPMTIDWLGNSSVATIPTLLDLIQKGKFKDQVIKPGDIAVFASVGAGMNINCIIYRF